MLVIIKSFKSEEFQILEGALTELIESKRKFKGPDFQIEITCEVQNEMQKEISIFDRVEAGVKKNSIIVSNWNAKGKSFNSKKIFFISILYIKLAYKRILKTDLRNSKSSLR